MDIEISTCLNWLTLKQVCEFEPKVCWNMEYECKTKEYMV